MNPNATPALSVSLDNWNQNPDWEAAYEKIKDDPNREILEHRLQEFKAIWENPQLDPNEFVRAKVRSADVLIVVGDPNTDLQVKKRYQLIKTLNDHDMLETIGFDGQLAAGVTDSVQALFFDQSVIHSHLVDTYLPDEEQIKEFEEMSVQEFNDIAREVMTSHRTYEAFSDIRDSITNKILDSLRSKKNH
jgi:hypothetical protein